MTPENFVYWLQGFMELGNPEGLTESQVREIRSHIDLVLNKVTPNYSILSSLQPTNWLGFSDKIHASC